MISKFYMTEIFNQTHYKQRRRDLRKKMPQAEILVWWKLRNKQLQGSRFRRQYSIAQFIVDFYCPTAKLAIEIDGETHISEDQENYDKKRQKFIESQGIKVIRFTNSDVYENLEGVIEKIGECLKNLSNKP